MGREAVVDQGVVITGVVDHGVVITGTDTGVGKTVVAAALAALWRSIGEEVTYVKPVQSGASEGDDDAAEVEFLARVAAVTGPRIGPALAPGIAARLAGHELTRSTLVETVPSAGRPPVRLVVEGAGGLLVELGSDGTNVADLAAALGLPLLVVARPGLGTLNHTALTIEAVLRRGLGFVGVVVCRYPVRPDLACRTNLGELDRISGGRLVGVVPELQLQDPDALAGCASWFGPELGGIWDKQAFRVPPGTPADCCCGVTGSFNAKA